MVFLCAPSGMFPTPAPIVYPLRAASLTHLPKQEEIRKVCGTVIIDVSPRCISTPHAEAHHSYTQTRPGWFGNFLNAFSCAPFVFGSDISADLVLLQETSLAKRRTRDILAPQQGFPGSPFPLKHQMLGFTSFDEAMHVNRRQASFSFHAGGVAPQNRG
jgi:hypothetical protein